MKVCWALHRRTQTLGPFSSLPKWGSGVCVCVWTFLTGLKNMTASFGPFKKSVTVLTNRRSTVCSEGGGENRRAAPVQISGQKQRVLFCQKMTDSPKYINITGSVDRIDRSVTWDTDGLLVWIFWFKLKQRSSLKLFQHLLQKCCYTINNPIVLNSLMLCGSIRSC